MNNNNFIRFFGYFILSFTLIICTFITTQAFKQIKVGSGNISVKGCAEKEIRSDFVTWSGTISAGGVTEMEAYEKLEKQINILQKKISTLNYPVDQVEFSPVSFSIKYELNDKGYSTNHVQSITLHKEFSLASSDIFLITKLSQEITSLFKEGITIVSHPPKYFYSKLDDLKIAMLGSAAADAYQRAEKIVSSSGARVGPLRSAHQGVFQITPVYSNSVSDYGEFDTSSIDKRIKAVVTMEFGID